MTPEARVLATLSGHGRWQTLSDLATVLHLSRRDVEAAVGTLRLSGHPVVGGNEGVKLTNDPLELDAYVSQRRYRTAAIHRGTMALRSTLRRMRYGAQEPLWREIA
jgi:biotin operon repressor